MSSSRLQNLCVRCYLRSSPQYGGGHVHATVTRRSIQDYGRPAANATHHLTVSPEVRDHNDVFHATPSLRSQKEQAIHLRSG